MIGNEIREQLASYVLQEIPLESFEDWFVARSWNAQRSSDEEIRNLVYAIEAALSEYSGGHIREKVLRAKLSEMVERYTVTIGASDALLQVHTGSSQPVTPPFEMQIQVVDIRPSVAFV